MGAFCGCSESGREYVQLGCNLEAAVQVLRYLFEPSESFTIAHDNFLLLLEVTRPCKKNLVFVLISSEYKCPSVVCFCTKLSLVIIQDNCRSLNLIDSIFFHKFGVM